MSGTIPPTAPKARSGLLDLFRLIWAYGVVQYHAGASFRVIAWGALPAFLIVTMQLSASRAAAGFDRDALRSRFVRLMFPWFAWSAVYAAGRFFHAPPDDRFGWFEWHMLLSGTAIHLWFLPAAFVLACLFAPFARLRAHRPMAAFAVASVGAGAALMAMITLKGVPAPPPFSQWRASLPCLFFAALLPSAVARRGGAGGGPRADGHGTLALAGIAVSFALVGLAWAAVDVGGLGYGSQEIASTACGLISVVPALCIRTASNIFTRAAGGAAFLVYLAHPLVDRAISPVLGLEPADDRTAAIVFATSLVLAVLVNTVLGAASRAGEVAALVIGGAPLRLSPASRPGA